VPVLGVADGLVRDLVRQQKRKALARRHRINVRRNVEGQIEIAVLAVAENARDVVELLPVRPAPVNLINLEVRAEQIHRAL
jgi:hypothetical protein